MFDSMVNIAPLTPEAFAPFGDVISVDAAQKHFPINGGTTERFHQLAQIELLGDNAQAIISIFRGQARHAPIELTMVERHPLGSQAFIPLSSNPYLVVVAHLALTVINASDLRIFWCNSNQGVNYRAGVWHHPLLALTETSDFLVVDRSGDGNNCEERDLSHPITISASHIENAQGLFGSKNQW